MQGGERERWADLAGVNARGRERERWADLARVNARGREREMGRPGSSKCKGERERDGQTWLE